MPDNHREPSVIFERRGGVALVRLNETRTLNALSAGIKDGLIAAIDQIAGDTAIRAAVITGNGRAFCAGGDIRNMADRAPANVRRRMQSSHGWVTRLLNCEKPILTAVNGVAAGAGFSLALLGDIVYGADNATFRAGFPNVGAAPDLALAYTLPRAVGAVRAKDILLTNRDIPVSEACAMGLVARIFPAETLVEDVLAIAERLADSSTLALGLSKRLVGHAFDMTIEAFLEQEAFAQTTAFGSADFAEGVAAFLDKRKPRFTGN